jgi:hypothetical protein
MENLISLQSCHARSVTKVLGLVESICGHALTKPSAEDAGSILRISTAIYLREMCFNIKRRLQG